MSVAGAPCVVELHRSLNRADHVLVDEEGWTRLQAMSSAAEPSPYDLLGCTLGQIQFTGLPVFIDSCPCSERAPVDALQSSPSMPTDPLGAGGDPRQHHPPGLP